MYQEVVTTQAEAITHLFLHCCYRDGVFTKSEIKTVSDKLVAAGLQADLNFKEEINKYQSYRLDITDEGSYLEYLIGLIMPVNELALFSYCIELCLSDTSLDPKEERFLNELGTALNIEEQEQEVSKKLIVQRKIVETQQIF